MPNKTVEFPKLVIASIDIGTNSAHMVIAEIDHVGEMRIIDSDKVNLRLGKAIDANGNLSNDGIHRTVEALRHMQQIATTYKPVFRAVATHATREAKNHKQLIQAIENATGIHVELIDGIEEARLVFLGMRYGLSLNNTPCLAVDIGGGSTEIIVAKDDQIDFVSSFKLGCVTLTDKYFSKKYSAEELKKIKDHITSRLAPLQNEARRYTYQKALASSGTAKALAFLHARKFGGIEMSDPNGYIIPRDDLLKMVENFETYLTPQRIKDETGLEASRADIILPGAIILGELTKIFKVSEWVITSFGLREGNVADTFYRTYGQSSADLPDIQWNSVMQFAKRLQINEIHALKVKKLALRIFDQISSICRPDDSKLERDLNRKLLRAAAYLREAGKFISSPQYHKHSQYIISNSRLPGFTETERTVMGLIARHQRKQVLPLDLKGYDDLTPSDFKRARFLSAIVRIAAALDRTRQNLIHDVEIHEEQGELIITIIHGGDRVPEVESLKVSMEKSNLEKSWNKQIQFRHKPFIGELIGG
jgi:exopolyphosphatase/guanosine-5'-triphosphate,3'-diphosphate pyrophosphatase